MSTTAGSASQTPRQSNRSAKRNPKIQANGRPPPSEGLDTTPHGVYPSTPPRQQQLNTTEYSINGVDAPAGESTTRKKKGKPTPKPYGSTQPPAQVADAAAKHRHKSSHSTGMAAERNEATPAKFAYAGPTFHASPAPSALPLPGFFSKSVPESPAPVDNSGTEDDASAPEEGTPSKLRSPKPRLAHAREPSPLDFIFDAAIQARASPRVDSPNGPTTHTPPTGDKVHNHGRHLSSGGGMFPFEADSAWPTPRNIGPAFATPYKDRINALRSNDSPVNSEQQQLDEDQRKAKSEALKRLLFNPQPHRAASASPRLHDNRNTLDTTRPSHTPTGSPSNNYRTVSESSTPRSFDSPQNALADFPLLQQSLAQSSPRQRPQASGLRTETNPINHSARAELPSESVDASQAILQQRSSPGHATPRSAMARHSYVNGQPSPAQAGTATPKPTPEEMVDQLRNVLKLGPSTK